MRAVAAGWHVGDPQEGPERVIVERIGGKEVLMLVIASSSPEVTDLLGLDLLVARKRRAVKGRSGDL